MNRSASALLVPLMIALGGCAWMPVQSSGGPSPIIWDDGPADDDPTVWRGVVEKPGDDRGDPAPDGPAEQSGSSANPPKDTEEPSKAFSGSATLHAASGKNCPDFAGRYRIRDLTRPWRERRYLTPDGSLCMPGGAR